jgi:sugar phosphate isomerase/epimerase
VHPKISINTLCLPPAPFPDQVERLARLGTAAISPTVPEVEDAGIAASAAALRDAGIAAALVTHQAFPANTAPDIASEQAKLNRSIEVAAGIGAGHVLLTTGGRGTLGWRQAAERFAEAIAPCVKVARAAGVTLAIEPTSHLYADISLVHRLSDTARIARMAGIGVIPDLFACWTDADLPEAIDDAGPLLGVIQVSDYAYGGRALPCRVIPGDGVIPLPAIIAAIAATGFAGYYDLEIIGPALASEGHDAGLRRGGAYITKILEGLPE